MKRLLLLLCLLSCSGLFAQKQPLPLIIKGKLKNCPESRLQIVLRDEFDQLTIDTISVDKQGNFYFKTFDVKAPQKTAIRQNNIQINELLVAPGYDLTITADAKDFRTLVQTKKITGTGAHSNRYRLMLDSIVSSKKEGVPYYELDEKGLINFLKDERKLKDSVVNIVFNKTPAVSQDKFSPYFKQMIKFDNIFADLSMLMSLANTHNYNYDQSLALINKNFDNDILNHMFRPEYMVSRYYRDFMAGDYIRFMVRLDKMKNSALASNDLYALEKVKNTYKDPIKSLVLYKYMDNAIYFSKSFAQLNNYKAKFQPFLVALTNGVYKKSLNATFLAKEKDLLRTEIGKPAPNFVALTASDGKQYSLSDFKGKVIYLDLWASWCKPCRAETPAFKELYRKYKTDDRLAFISIAVLDGMTEWQKALGEDQPEWLQLIDKDGIVSRSYVSNTIPKFILINKQGNIVSFDAPMPSNKTELERLLATELSK